MSVYLSDKFEVSSVILTRFRQGGVVVEAVILPLPPPQNELLKSPPRLGSKILRFPCEYVIMKVLHC